ncbi:hypothetical protein DD238_007619 [Peronospora effusa]|uniref:Uncharacterized protein n=1 Tax=Peronospora effusa TaxID=542832 RepID=A0A3M6VGC4_9STRA|nr:hypothetical protein DD238_007619 [Peronospora effusa]RQM15612.1 hypothetical protein DD237_003523 [Peronospora effusa]
MRGFRLKYDRWLQDFPLLTKGVTSAILFGLGDRFAQRLETNDDKSDREDRYGLKRTARMMVWGGLVFGPIGHVWYNFLEKTIRGKGTAAIIKKIAIDQVILAPPLALAFFTYAGYAEGEPLHDTVKTAVTKLRPTLAVNWTVWPLVHVGTFGFVPLQYRVLYINVANIGWSAFLSQMASKDGQFYHYWLHKAPLVTKVLTAATLSGVGDRLAQHIEATDVPSTNLKRQPSHLEKEEGIVSPSTARTLRMVVWGGLFTAPIMHTWFHIIDRVIPGVGTLVVAKKVAADMVIVAPAMNLGFFIVTKTMEGARLSDAVDFATANLPPTLVMSYKVWPVANLVVFSLVPLQYRTPFVNCVSLGWSTFLSIIANKKSKNSQDVEDVVKDQLANN